MGTAESCLGQKLGAGYVSSHPRHILAALSWHGRSLMENGLDLMKDEIPCPALIHPLQKLQQPGWAAYP